MGGWVTGVWVTGGRVVARGGVVVFTGRVVVLAGDGLDVRGLVGVVVAAVVLADVDGLALVVGAGGALGELDVKLLFPPPVAMLMMMIATRPTAKYSRMFRGRNMRLLRLGCDGTGGWLICEPLFSWWLGERRTFGAAYRRVLRRSARMG